MLAPVWINLLRQNETFRKKKDMNVANENYALDNKLTTKIIWVKNIPIDVEYSNLTCSFAFYVKQGRGVSLWPMSEFTSKYSCVLYTYTSFIGIQYY